MFHIDRGHWGSDDFDSHRQAESVRAAVYSRTSSYNQRFGYSLGEQTRRCIERCQLLDWVISFIFQDEAESGKDANRPMFQRMMSCAEAGAIDVVVFWKLDRFSRSLLHAVQLEAELRKSDVALYSVTEQIDTTSSAGRFNFRNIASAAEFERDMIKERSQMGLKALATDLGWPNSKPPLGYDVAENGRLAANSDEAEVVLNIFEDYLHTKSMPVVAQNLNDAGLKTKRGTKWSGRTVGKILGNRIYKGEYSVAGVNKQVEEFRIVPDEMFERSEEIRSRFQSANGDSRKEMSQRRRDAIVDKMVDQYNEFLSVTPN